MTGRDRLFAVLQGQPVDRRPVVPLLSLYGARLTNCPVPEYYQRAEAFARGQEAVAGLFRPDVVFAPFALAAEAAAFGATEAFGRNRPPIVSKPAAASVAEALRLPLPDIDAHPRLEYLREALRGVVQRCGREAVVAAPMLGPMDLPALLVGLDAWLDALLFAPDEAARLVRRCMGHFVAWSNALLRDGADLVVLPMVFSNPSIVGARVAESMVAGLLREAVSAVKGPVVLHHGGCPMTPHLPLVADLPANVIGFALGAGEDLRAARAAVGPQRLLLGTLDGSRLDASSPDAIAARCADTLAEAADDPRFVLGSSNADIPLDTPPAHVFAMLYAVSPQPLSADRSRPSVIACSIFRPEIERLRSAGTLDAHTAYIDSTLHLDPKALEAVLASAIDAQARFGVRTALVYGDCHAHMVEHTARAGVARPWCLNCCELYLGRDRYRELRREGAFIVLPEWAERWRETLQRTLGPDPVLAQQIMRELHTRLVYVTKPGAPVPRQALDEMSDYAGLPWSVEELDPAVFERAITELLDRA